MKQSSEHLRKGEGWEQREKGKENINWTVNVEDSRCSTLDQGGREEAEESDRYQCFTELSALR